MSHLKMALDRIKKEETKRNDDACFLVGMTIMHAEARAKLENFVREQGLNEALVQHLAMCLRQCEDRAAVLRSDGSPDVNAERFRESAAKVLADANVLFEKSIRDVKDAEADVDALRAALEEIPKVEIRDLVDAPEYQSLYATRVAILTLEKACGVRAVNERPDVKEGGVANVGVDANEGVDANVDADADPIEGVADALEGADIAAANAGACDCGICYEPITSECFHSAAPRLGGAGALSGVTMSCCEQSHMFHHRCMMQYIKTARDANAIRVQNEQPEMGARCPKCMSVMPRFKHVTLVSKWAFLPTIIDVQADVQADV